MNNFLIKRFFSFYVWYQLKSPIKKGNAFLGRLIKNLTPLKYDINGLLLKLNPVSYIDFHLIAYKTHDNEIRNWIDQYLHPEDLFLDIGANIGYFSVYAAKIKKAKVISFEPSKRELARFYENIALNQLNNIVVFPFALGNEITKVKLNLANFQNPGKNSIINSHSSDFTSDETIDIFTLKDLVSTHQISQIKLVKIDVEGYEYQVLMGLSSVMAYLNQAVFIVEITTYLDKDPELLQTQSIYDFFKKYDYRAQIGLKINEQYNEVFIK